MAERTEIQRVLDELSRRVESAGDDLDAVMNALASIDLLLAKAQLAEHLECERPALDGSGVLDLVAARHPLLVERGTGAVPIDVRLGSDFRALVITGPNTGGKTVTLRTIGLLVLMAASGLQIPAGRGSRVAARPGRRGAGARGIASLRAAPIARAHPARGRASAHRARGGARGGTCRVRRCA